jgi:hypothetical protein
MKREADSTKTPYRRLVIFEEYRRQHTGYVGSSGPLPSSYLSLHGVGVA